jgi:hypothetical protein
VPKHQTCRGGCTASYHVLIAAANISGHYFKYNTMMALPVANGQFWIIYFAYFNLTGLDIRNTVVLTHNIFNLKD